LVLSSKVDLDLNSSRKKKLDMPKRKQPSTSSGTRFAKDRINEKKNALLSHIGDLSDLKRRIDHAMKELETCKDVEDILKYKSLQRKLKIWQTKRKEMEGKDIEQEMNQEMEILRELERKNKMDHAQKVKEEKKKIKPWHRLYPPKPTQRSMFDVLGAKKADLWSRHRAYRKRFALLFGKDIQARRMNVDRCDHCGSQRSVDRELDYAVCGTCSRVVSFGSHIFETKDTEQNDASKTRMQQSLEHMQKFGEQFERGHPCAPPETLEQLSVAYRRFHFRDPAKVQSSRTSAMIKKCTDIPKVHKRAPERITKVLKGDAVPEYTPDEFNQLLDQRNRLQLPELGDDSKQKKSYSNLIYMRQFGRANGMEQSRLFQHARTNAVHVERLRELEDECIEVKKKQALANNVDSSLQWSLYPAS